METVAADQRGGKRGGFEVHFGREAPGGDGKLVAYATDEHSLWVWFFGWELVVSRKVGVNPTG
jgi:hypothetical protein